MAVDAAPAIKPPPATAFPAGDCGPHADNSAGLAVAGPEIEEGMRRGGHLGAPGNDEGLI